MAYLYTEDGQIIQTESGQGILVSEETSNADIQLLDFSVQLLRAILWEYNDATTLQALLEEKNAWYFANQTQFWNYWINNVFNLATANDFGLSVWSIILNQPIFLNNGPSLSSKLAWGFGAYHKNFTRGNFSSNTGNTYRLPTAIARIVLQLRYFQLVSSGTVPEINRMLKYVFENYGSAYLQDRLDMTQRYYFAFQIPSDLLLAFQDFDLLPRPAAVKSSIYQGSRLYWGFGPHHANFTNGNFGE